MGITKINYTTDRSIGIFCCLHTLCNLKCKFCSQTKEDGIRDHSSVNMDYIKQLPDDIISEIVPIIKENKVISLAVNIMGGELFFDNIPDSFFNAYKEFCFTLRNKFKEEVPDVKVILMFVTNGVYTKHERVEKLLNEVNANMGISYDPTDRFTSQSQKDMWYNTFKYFKDRIGSRLVMYTVLTKKAIDAYIAGDKTFEKTGTDVCLEIQEYSPRLDYDDYLPSDDDLFRFYKWALDNGKFNIYTMRDIIDNIPSCNRGSNYVFREDLGVKYINYCIESSSVPKECFYGDYSSEFTDKKCYSDKVLFYGLEKRGCLLCEYYTRCPKMCWLQVLFDKYHMSECPISRVYKYLEENPNILVNYNKWREQYGKLRSSEKETKEN